MLNAKGFAHAVTVVTAVFYLVCWILSALAPDLVAAIAQTWIHSISLDALRTSTPLAVESVLIGLVTIAAVTWVTTYATIWLYNRLAKK